METEKTPERWVNAKITFTIPLDGVSVEDSPGKKAAAAFQLAEKEFPEMPDNAVGEFGFEDVEDGEPIRGPEKTPERIVEDLQLIVKTLRQSAWWSSESETYLQAAEAVESADAETLGMACPVCEEVDCDEGCPLEEIRRSEGEK